MKITELKVQNIVRWKYGEDEYNTVHSIDPEQIDLQIITPFGVRPEDIEGVPLTEEWLLKFSWQLVKGNDFYLNSNFCIGYDGAGRLYCNGDYKGVNVFYVHQLQNLYFALTGEELTINK